LLELSGVGLDAIQAWCRHDRVKATNRVHKLLETANIKLANVVADVLGVSGRAMLNALVRGETDPERLAKLAKGSLTRR
jgi:transposase